jgi:transcriptional regulator with XRE-family HTH domain
MANNGVAVNGKAIRDARLRKGWTLRDVSDACEELARKELGCKVDYGNVSQYERGLIRPNPRTLYTLAMALGVTVDDLRDPSELAA